MDKKPTWKLVTGKAPDPKDLPKDLPSYDELQKQVTEQDNAGDEE